MSITATVRDNGAVPLSGRVVLFTATAPGVLSVGAHPHLGEDPAASSQGLGQHPVGLAEQHTTAGALEPAPPVP